MLRRLVARILRPLKRGVLWLTGERELHGRLDHIAAHLNRLDVALQNLAIDQRPKTDQWHAEVVLPLSGLHGKFDRLHADLYLLHEKVDLLHLLHEKVDHLHIRFVSLSEASSPMMVSAVASEIDRLDGYLNYHAGRLQSTLESLDSKASRLAEEAGRLAGDLDRLDGNISRHFGELKARLR